MKKKAAQTGKQPATIRHKRKPGDRATRAEVTARVETVARLLADKQATRTEIHAYCKAQWNLHWRSADLYVVRARKFIFSRSHKTRSEVFGDAIVFNEDVLRSSDADWRERALARKELNELYGIYPPKRTEVSGPNGEPVQLQPVPPKMTREQVLEAFKLQSERFAIEAAGNGKPVIVTLTPEREGDLKPDKEAHHD